MLWDDSLKIGIHSIDTQHQELLNRIDAFMDACMKQKGSEEMEKTLDFLSKYVISHFSYEQDTHAKLKYPKALEHKAMHDSFISQLNGIKSKFSQSGANLEVILLTNKALVDWIIGHIRAADKDFAEFYKKIEG